MTTQIEYEILHTNKFQSNPINHYHYRYQRKWSRIVIFLILLLLFITSVIYPPLGLPHYIVPVIWILVSVFIVIAIPIIDFFIKVIYYTVEALVEWLKGY